MPLDAARDLKALLEGHHPTWMPFSLNVGSFPGFTERLAPYVDESVLSLRKTNVDLRKWDYFRPFWEPPQGSAQE